jgi:hypothetical protein
MTKFISLQQKQNRSKYRIVMGIISILIGIGLPIYSAIYEPLLNKFGWVFSLLFIVNGIIYFLAGLGITLPELMGKKTYLIFDEDEIRFKTSNFDKETILKADHIRKIVFQTKFNDFILKDNQIVKMYLTGFEYALIQEIKEGITEYARINGISVES